MYECDICLAKINKRNKNKHEQSKKHKYYCSNLIINKYIVNKDEFKIFKGIFKTHCISHKKNLTTLMFQ